MSDPNTLGSLVRKRRLESGYSLGQLASKVGKTAAEVRAWERDAELPEHGIIERLASTLEIDLNEIKKRLAEGKKAFEAERRAAEKAEAAAVETAEPEPPAPAPADQMTDETADVSEEPDLPGFAVEDPYTPPPPVEDVPQHDGVVAGGVDPYLLDAPTEAVPVPIITDTATAARAGRAAAVLEEPPPGPGAAFGASGDEQGLLRYLEPFRVLFDPEQRYLYWIRAGLTIIVMLVFVVILLAQLGNLLDAVGELIDTIKPATNNTDTPVGMLSFLGAFL
jgi:transcriptional regulator with XRE-family HTH domain